MKPASVGLFALLFLASANVRAADAPAPADRAALVKDNTAFALDLYGKLREREGNLFLSPYSISTALGMTYAGARGETAEQMAKKLHFTLEPDRLHPAFAALVQEVNGEGKKRGYQLSTANALWGQKGYGFKEDFLKLTRDNYGAGLNEVDYMRSIEAARKTINAWVEKETNNKIKELIKDGMLESDTRLVLTNAIYFKGDWASQFKKDLTRQEEFRLGASGKVKTALMHQNGEFGYFEDKDVQGLELPYVGKDLSMVVLLPKKVDGLADLEKGLTADKLGGWMKALRPCEVIVTLPKFKTTSEFRMKEVLSELGMPIAFSRRADFSRMNGGQEPLMIGDVVHKAFVDVNEEGTEAAAATGVIAKPGSVQADPVFRADHPFVFLIRDRRNDSILFLGRLADPSK
jgi:serpin B